MIEEDVEEEEEELGIAETYSDYMPSKSKYKCFVCSSMVINGRK